MCDVFKEPAQTDNAFRLFTDLLYRSHFNDAAELNLIWGSRAQLFTEWLDAAISRNWATFFYGFGPLLRTLVDGYLLFRRFCWWSWALWSSKNGHTVIQQNFKTISVLTFVWLLFVMEEELLIMDKLKELERGLDSSLAESTSAEGKTHLVPFNGLWNTKYDTGMDFDEVLEAGETKIMCKTSPLMRNPVWKSFLSKAKATSIRFPLSSLSSFRSHNQPHVLVPPRLRNEML